MCIVRIANNINRNVYMYLNTRIFSDYWLRTSAVIHVYKARARRNCLFQFVCFEPEKVTDYPDFLFLTITNTHANTSLQNFI